MYKRGTGVTPSLRTISSGHTFWGMAILNKRKLTPADTQMKVVKKLRFSTPQASPCHSVGRGQVRCRQLQCYGSQSVSEPAEQAINGENTEKDLSIK